jgi:hypothetical protein
MPTTDDTPVPQRFGRIGRLRKMDCEKLICNYISEAHEEYWICPISLNSDFIPAHMICKFIVDGQPVFERINYLTLMALEFSHNP